MTGDNEAQQQQRNQGRRSLRFGLRVDAFGGLIVLLTLFWQVYNSSNAVSQYRRVVAATFTSTSTSTATDGTGTGAVVAGNNNASNSIDGIPQQQQQQQQQQERQDNQKRSKEKKKQALRYMLSKLNEASMLVKPVDPSNEYCTPPSDGTNAHQTFPLYNKLHEVYTDPSDVFDRIPRRKRRGALGKPNAVVCKFRRTGGVWNQFPHTMQQLYRCFSLFRSQPDREPILSMEEPNRVRKYPRQFHVYLRTVWNVTYDNNLTYGFHNNAYTVDAPTTFDAGHGHRGSYRVLETKHFKELRDSLIANSPRLTNDGASGSTANPLLLSPPPACNGVPRVGFLNREGSSRVVENHVQIMEQLRRQLGSVAEFEYLKSFDNMTMVEQTSWMYRHDVVISPHGAQLTSIPFMPDHGAVLELNANGFYEPNWFGPLAGYSGQQFVLLYGGENMTRQVRKHSKTIASKNLARSKSMCHNVNAVLSAVAQMIDEWRVRVCSSSTATFLEEKI